MTGLCVVLKRLAYPTRYSDLIYTFGLSVPELCIVDHIYEIHGHRLSQWNHTLLSAQNLQICAECVARKGAALENCLGFADGTVRPICGPDKKQISRSSK